MTLTDAGPPPPIELVVAWGFVLLVSFIIYGVIRPAAGRPTLLSHHSSLTDNRSRLWWVRRLHLCVGSWALFDLVHRGFCYALLSSHALARLHMLPLVPGVFSWWINCLRLALLCGTAEMTGDGMCADWELPVGDVVSVVSAESMRTDERERWQYVVLAAEGTVVCIVLSLHTAFAWLSARVSKCTSGGSANGPAADTAGAEDSHDGESVSESGPDAEEEEGHWWGLGEPDDAWLESPEAAAAELCGESHESVGSQRDTPNDPSGFMRECWPVLVAVGYAGLYAHTGGLPLLIRWVYPLCILLVLGAAVVT